jgi:indolepyruvate decarboxylase
MAYTVTDFLLDRLSELGADHMFGVPGDFTLGLLDHVDAHPDVDWVGTASELGAGYAADGYARLRGLGVVCTTFGVGELSALNALAGSYAERVPVLALVGAPTTAVQRAGRPTHHSLGDGDFAATLRVSAEFTVAQAALTTANATLEIDRVLTAMLRASRPGYLSLPADVAEAPADPPRRPLHLAPRPSDPGAVARFREAARELLAGAEPPVVLADVLVQRAGAEEELHALLQRGGLRHASLLWGRRVVDEAAPGFLGTYVGAASDPAVRAAVEDADRLITAGVCFTDLTSGFFSQHLDDTHRIDLLPHSALVGGTTLEGVRMADALRVLADLVGDRPAPAATATTSPRSWLTECDDPLSQATLWEIIADALQAGDLVTAEQGTAFYGLGAHRLPHDVLFFGQPLWASIGYTLPALLGAALAAPHRRPVLLIGDGAAQMTIQELGTLIRRRVPAIIVIVNNAGYTVERAIHGPAKAYNDIAAWRWTDLPAALGGDGFAHGVRAETPGDLAAALVDARADAERLTLIEAVTPALDVPPLLTAVAEAAAQANAA